MSQATKSKYEEMGVDPHKSNVRKIFGAVVNNDYPGAFVNIVEDPSIIKQVLTQHQDGDGSKSVQRMLHYLETKDETIFRYMVDDALSMNTGDIAAAGFVFGTWVLTDILNVNLGKELKEIVMQSVAIRFQELKELYKKNGFNSFLFLGGETADLKNQITPGTFVFDIGITAWAKKDDLITGNIKPDDKIYGFASDGKAKWEQEPNSGIGSNGLTLARSCLMHQEYNFKYNPVIPNSFYEGKFKVWDTPQILGRLTVSEALLSPTRQWAIVIHKILSHLKKMNCSHLLHGITMNTGGGATKIKNIGRGGIVYYKQMPKMPPLFELIQEESGETLRGMYETFNCGVGIDLIGKDDPRLHEVLREVSRECGIKLYELGHCEACEGKNKVILYTGEEYIEYS
ncbi:hypothetical protein KKA39_00560 [Patescibacteria group bacterium]|nr:hypothetical protein [Patescibacteria group bacterium]MBU1727796.1 hypothetical protein [Patescibacteria group bacterium]